VLARVRLLASSAQLRAAVQLAAFGSAALYTVYYVGEARLAATTLFAVVGTLTAVWAISYGILLLTTDRKYVSTFFSTQTGRDCVMNYFLHNHGNDELRAQIFFCNQELWRPIRPQVQAWVRLRFKIWKQTNPAWFTQALMAGIPTEMLPPRDSKRLEAQAQAQGRRHSSIHDPDASLARRLTVTLGINLAAQSAAAVALNQVAPLQGPAAAEDPDSESSDSDTEAGSGRDTAGASAVCQKAVL
jgi:hypothetical protein